MRAVGGPSAPVAKDAASDLPPWLKGLTSQVKGLFAGLAKKPEPAPAATGRRVPEKKQPPPMPPEEKAFFDGLSAPEQATYMALSHAQRELARQGPQGRERLSTTREPAASGAEPVAAGDLAGQLTTELFVTLGEAPDAPSTRGALRGVVLQTVANLLRETGGNVPAMKTRALIGLLDQPEFANLLLANVERELLTLPPSTRKGAQSYHEAFKRLRPELIAHARKLVYPGLTSAELIGTLVDVIVELVDQQPRTGARRGAGGRGKKVAFQGRFIRG